VDGLSLVQWPAMLVTVAASYLVGSSSPVRRLHGFRLFLLSNALWMLWGFHASAWALIVLQLALAPTNVRGARKTEDAAPQPADD
jgi:hypothetical protein